MTVLASVVAACQGPPRGAPPPSRPSIDAEPPPVAEHSLPADGGARPVDASFAPITDDESFRALAEAIAIRTEGRILGWGTVELDDAAPRERYAVIDSSRRRGGSYLIESSGNLWLVDFESDGRTHIWAGDDDRRDTAHPEGALPWIDRPDTFIRHDQGHRGGYERTDFAIADDALVVRAIDYLDDGRAGDRPVRTTFPCTPTCKPLATNTDSSGITQVRGPATTLDALL
jgi:hypothetical protein